MRDQGPGNREQGTGKRKQGSGIRGAEAPGSVRSDAAIPLLLGERLGEGAAGNQRTSLRLELAVLGALLLAVLSFGATLHTAPPALVELAGFTTSLSERTPGQKHNAKRAADAINGHSVPPGGIFSFNRTVGSWTVDNGYVKAPVSYEGDLIRAYGGGVCQTSTTLYNAALLAGLPILERHAHAFAPHYVPAGRDAAVAQYDIDLRFRNPYPWPIRIEATAGEQRLNVRILGAQKPAQTIAIACDVLSRVEPRHLTRLMRPGEPYADRPYLRNPGAVGCRTVSYRIFSSNGIELRRERLGDDTYQAMNRVVQVVE